MAKPIHTTISFRAAYRRGVPHLAGHGVVLHPTETRKGITRYRIWCRGIDLGNCYSPKAMRERSGIQREAETRYPGRSKPKRRR